MENEKIERKKKTKSKKAQITKSVENKTLNEQKIKEETFFGHKEGEDIWQSFLTNKMFAHRGLWNKDLPENSLSAFKNALDNGYGIELDISPIEDETPVIFHDEKLSRMTGKDRYIQNLSKDELKDIKLLNTDEHIPTLEEILKLVNGKVPLLIEIKNHDNIGRLEKKVLELLKKYKGEYAIQSFNPYILKWFFEHEPRIWRGQLSSYFKGEKLGFFKKLILKSLKVKKIAKYDFVNYDIKNIPNRFVKKLEVPLLSWTIKKQDDYIKAIQYCDSVVFEGFEPKI